MRIPSIEILMGFFVRFNYSQTFNYSGNYAIRNDSCITKCTISSGNLALYYLNLKIR